MTTPIASKSIQAQHEELLEQNDLPLEQMLPNVQAFLDQLAQAGTTAQRSEQRAHLRTLMRYWSSYVYDKTGAFPFTQLHPYDPPTSLEVPSNDIATNICSACGTPNPPNEIFCDQCGTRLIAPRQPLSLAVDKVPSVSLPNIGGYTLVEEIGKGGFSTVYMGLTSSGEPVAVKILDGEKVRERDLYDQLLQNELTAKALDHPNILQIRDAGLVDDVFYVVTNYIAAGSLATRLSQNFWRPRLRDILMIAKQVAEALEYLQNHGIIHRDIKPGNILLDDKNHVYLADFGVAHVINQVYIANIVGTLEYMAPEVVMKSEQITPVVDLYSFGVVLYELISGERPFHGTTPDAIMQAQILYQPPSLKMIGVPLEVADLVDACLEKKPDSRLQSARILGEGIQHALDSLQSEILDLRFAEFTSSPEQRQHETMAGIHTPTMFTVSQTVGIRDAPTVLPPPMPTVISHPKARSYTSSSILEAPTILPPPITRAISPPKAPSHTSQNMQSNWYVQSTTVRRTVSDLITGLAEGVSQAIAMMAQSIQPNGAIQHQGMGSAAEYTLDPDIVRNDASWSLKLPVAVFICIENGDIFPVKKRRLVFGRSPLCDIISRSSVVAAQHALIVYSTALLAGDSPFTLFDLGSMSGTLVNGKRIIHSSLQHNDKVTIGKSEFVFKRLDDASVRTPANRIDPLTI